jgi:hypothetical protein
MSEDNFIGHCVEGKTFLYEIDDYIATWHEGRTGKPVWKYLGMSQDEYKLWLEQPSSLRVIVAAHDQHVNVEDLLSSPDAELVAARADFPDDAQRLLAWLRHSGRLT